MKSLLAILSILFLVILSTKTFPQDLVAYYPFNNNADDYSGNNNHGTVFGATLTEDRFGNLNAAYSFDGYWDYIEVFNPNNLGLTSWTITGWIKVPGDVPIESEEYNIVGKLQNENEKYNFGVLQKTGLTLFSQYETDDDENDHYVSYNPIDIEVWFSFTSIRDAVTGRHALYVNGELTQQTQQDFWNDVPTTSQQNLLIGRHFSFGYESEIHWFNGLIDDIRIYNGALPEQAVGLIYTLECIEIHHGILNSFWAKLNSAFRSLSIGETNAALNKLNAFINEVEAQRGKELSESDADELIAKAQDLIDEINAAPLAKRISSQHDTAIPEGYGLFQNYPNPFNPSTLIRFNLPEATNVNLSIYNVSGQLVSTLVDQYSEAGSYNVQWIAHDCPSGIYTARLRAGGFSTVMKMMLLK